MDIPGSLSGVDWRSVAALAGGVGTLASPFLLAWWNGRLRELETSARMAETTAERMERAQREAFERLERECEHCRQRALAAEAAEREADQLAELAVANGRAMDDWAHWMRHGWVNRNTSFRSLLKLLEGLLNGTVANEWGAAIVVEYREHPVIDPPFIPALKDAGIIRPPEIS